MIGRDRGEEEEIRNRSWRGGEGERRRRTGVEDRRRGGKKDERLREESRRGRGGGGRRLSYDFYTRNFRNERLCIIGY